MKQISGFCAVAVLSLALCAAAGEWRGTISDKMCGGDHKGLDPVKCTLSCIDHGSTYVLVVSSDTILNIENQNDAKIAAELRKSAGLRVTATGTLSNDGQSIRIEKIKS